MEVRSLSGSERKADVASEEELDLAALFGTLLDHRVLITSCTSFFTMLALAYVTFATPIYQASALIQVEEKAASLPGLEDLSEAFGSESSTQAELEILKSRSVVGNAVTNLKLTTRVQPHLFPLIGDYISRTFIPTDEQPYANALLDLHQYAWGGESITVELFDTRSSLFGETFWVTYLGGEDYYIENNSILGTVSISRLSPNIFKF